MTLNFKMLPEEVRVDKNVTVFSKEEELNDLMENGKYNKKQMRLV